MPTNTIHADGTDCCHSGPPSATVHDDGGPRCAAGQQITHVRFNGQVITVDEACRSVQRVADVWVTALTPVITQMTAWVKTAVGVLSPTLRILAAAAEAVDEERAREAGL